MTHTQHTSRHYEHDLKELRDKILLIGGHVEELIASSMKALIQADAELAKKSIKLDQEINRLEKQIDELCINILALRQPTASDLRFIITSLKIVTDLERMGDLGVNIAQRALDLLSEPPLKPYIHLPILAQMAQKMMKDSLDALVKGSESLAESVMANDDAVDDLTHKIIDELMVLMKEDTQNINRGVKLISVAKYLERLADHSTNVAEMVLFMMRGEDVRHPALRNTI